MNRILYVRNLPYTITAEELYAIFGKYGVSIKALTQKGLNTDGTATLTILTHNVKEKDLQSAVKEFENIKTIRQIENVIRVLD